MTQPNFYELIKKEQELIQRLEKILDKLESPMIINAEPIESIFKDKINHIYNAEPVIISEPDYLYEPDYLIVNFSPFTSLPVSIETDTHFYSIEVKNSITKEETK